MRNTILIAAGLVLAACGGGGGKAVAPNTSNTPNTPNNVGASVITDEVAEEFVESVSTVADRNYEGIMVMWKGSGIMADPTGRIRCNICSEGLDHVEFGLDSAAIARVKGGSGIYDASFRVPEGSIEWGGTWKGLAVATHKDNKLELLQGPAEVRLDNAGNVTTLIGIGALMGTPYVATIARDKPTASYSYFEKPHPDWEHGHDADGIGITGTFYGTGGEVLERLPDGTPIVSEIAGEAAGLFSGRGLHGSFGAKREQ